MSSLFQPKIHVHHTYSAPGFEQLAGVGGPLATIIITSYNYATFLPDTLASVYDQTYSALELIVVDDSSRDDSVRVLKAWMAAQESRFLRLQLVQHTKNQGLAQSRNTAFGLARGSRVFVLDSDNILLPRAIARHVEVMDRSSAEVVYAQPEFFDAERRLGSADLWDIGRLKRGNYIDAMAMVSRAAWEAVGGYSYYDVMGWEDYDLWLKFVEHGFRGVFIPEILCRYRVHKNSMQHIETSPKGARLAMEAALRHPWLELEPSRAPLFAEPQRRSNALRTEVKKLRETNSQLQEQNDNLSIQLQAILSSTSWRATGLLRRFGRATMRHRK